MLTQLKTNRIGNKFPNNPTVELDFSKINLFISRSNAQAFRVLSILQMMTHRIATSGCDLTLDPSVELVNILRFLIDSKEHDVCMGKPWADDIVYCSSVYDRSVECAIRTISREVFHEPLYVKDHDSWYSIDIDFNDPSMYEFLRICPTVLSEDVIMFPHTRLYKCLKRVMETDNGVILLDYPEAGLNEEEQWLFIRKLLELQKNHQYFISTHSLVVFNELRVLIKQGLISKDEVCVYYGPLTDNLDTLQRIHITADGRCDSWPSGFFDVQDKQLATIIDWNKP